MKKTTLSFLTALVFASLSSAVFAQDGAPNRDQFRARINEQLKASLKCSDEEWSVIQPLLEKVEAKQREAMTSRAFGGGDRTRGGGRGGQSAQSNRPQPPAASGEVTALRTALDSGNSSPEEIKAKLAALRSARKKAADELQQAREDLREVLTPRQEAVFVMTGILD